MYVALQAVIDDPYVYLQSDNVLNPCVCEREALPKSKQPDGNVYRDGLYHHGSLERIELDDGDDRCPILFQRFVSLHHGQ